MTNQIYLLFNSEVENEIAATKYQMATVEYFREIQHLEINKTNNGQRFVDA